MTTEPLQQLAIDVAVLKEQVSAMSDTLDRIDKVLTQNGMVENVTKTEMRVAGLERDRKWAFWILGAVLIGLLVNFLGINVR
jgi:hypothetical protein